MKVRIALSTEIGDRQVNEDYLLAKNIDERCFFAVADGLGGHGLGDYASRIACKTAFDVYSGIPSGTGSRFDRIYSACQEALLQKQREMHVVKQMRTTLNLLLIENGYAYWSHIGDSRTYYFTDQQLIKRTLDHSVPQLLVSSGDIEEEEIRFHEDRNRLLRVLGAEEVRPVFEEEAPVPLAGSQQFLLCSDGFWENITEEQMLLCLAEAEGPGLWMENMEELVRRNSQRKKSDNRTALAVWIES